MVDSIYDPMSEWSMFFLNNGIRVLHAYDPNIKFARVRFVMSGGALEGDKEVPGTTHFLEHIISPLNELTPQLGKLGLSSVNASTDDLSIKYHYRQLIDNKKILKVFRIHYKRLFDYADVFTQERYDQEFPIIKAEIISKMPDEMYLFNKQVTEYYGSVFDYSNIRGRIEDLEKISPNSLKAFYSSNHNVNNLFIMVSGGLEKSILLNLLKESGFDSVRKYGKRSEIYKYPLAPLKEVKFKAFHLENKGLGNIKYSRSYLLPPALYFENIYKAIVLAEILQRVLFSKIREELGLVYSIEVSINSAEPYYDMHATMQIDTSFADYQQVEEVSKQIESIVEGVFNLDESLFLEVRQTIINDLSFRINNIFIPENYICSKLIGSDISFFCDDNILYYYQNIQWEDLKIFKKYLKSDQGVLITEGLKSS